MKKTKLFLAVLSVTTGLLIWSTTGHAAAPPPDRPAAQAEAELPILKMRADPSVNYFLYYQIKPDGTVNICGTDSGSGQVPLLLPSRIDGKTVTSVCPVPAGTEFPEYSISGDFTGDMVIPDTITEIGPYAFENVRILEGTLKLGSGLREIGPRAFRFCNLGKQGLVIPDTVRTIGEEAFADRGSVYHTSPTRGRLILGRNVTSIGKRAFANGGFNGSLIIPDSVREIGEGAFAVDLKGSSRLSCSFTGSLAFGSGPLTLGAGAFENCSFRNTIDLGTGLTQIPDYAFSGCKFRGNPVLPDGLLTVGSYAFFTNCFTGTLTVPDSVTELGAQSFYSYPDGSCGFTALSLGSHVKTIGDLCFGRSLEGAITLPDSLESIGNDVFSRDHWNSHYITSINLPPNLKHIGARAFYDQTRLTGTLNLPDSLLSIGKDAFAQTRYTGTLVLPPHLEEVGGFKDLFTSAQPLVLPDSIRVIGDNAFLGCGFEGPVQFPDRLTSIGASAFGGCKFLTGDLILPDSVTEIGNYAFLGSGFDGTMSLPGSHLLTHTPGFPEAMKTLDVRSADSGDNYWEIEGGAFDTWILPADVSRLSIATYQSMPSTIRYRGTRDAWEASYVGYRVAADYPEIKVICTDDLSGQLLLTGEKAADGSLDLVLKDERAVPAQVTLCAAFFTDQGRLLGTRTVTRSVDPFAPASFSYLPPAGATKARCFLLDGKSSAPLKTPLEISLH